jgi:hypothetical protein
MATIAPPRRLSAEHRFYLGMAVAVLATVFAGFAPTYYLRGLVPAYRPFLPITPLIVLHGLLFSSWVLLFMAQVGLVSAGRIDVHRRLGRFGVVLLAGMIAVGLLTTLGGVARNSGQPTVPPLAWLAVPLLDIPVFTGLIGAGLLNRRTPQVHKRFMLVAMIGLLPPSIGRLPWPEAIPFPVIVIGGQALFLLPLVLWDLASRGRVHWVTITSAVVLIGSWLLRLAIWQTEPWLRFAGWAASFVG